MEENITSILLKFLNSERLCQVWKLKEKFEEYVEWVTARSVSRRKKSTNLNTTTFGQVLELFPISFSQFAQNIIL